MRAVPQFIAIMICLAMGNRQSHRWCDGYALQNKRFNLAQVARILPGILAAQAMNSPA
jgi:hypothetical protein